MVISIQPGKYVAAVSGGVDSVVLLDLMAKIPQIEIVVAHFDHGIRPDSEADRLFVEQLARGYNLAFKYKREELGTHASESLARERRYEFLKSVMAENAARAIITAHHADDDIETACINILRGTFRKGMSALHSNTVIRPLLRLTKSQILSYAAEHNLKWQEDSSNSDTKYLRNRIRQLLADADEDAKRRLAGLIRESVERNTEIDRLSAEVFEYGYMADTESFKRSFFISLPYGVSCEILALWLREAHIEFSKKNIGLLCVQLKTGRSGARFNAGKNLFFVIDGPQISLVAV